MDKTERELIDEKIKISGNFNKEVGKLFKMATMKIPNNFELERIRKLISLGKSTDQLILIENAKDKLWEYNAEISAEQEQFFLDSTFEKDKKNMSDAEDKKLVENLISIFKLYYPKLSAGEKREIWKSMKEMLRLAIAYKLICGEYN